MFRDLQRLEKGRDAAKRGTCKDQGCFDCRGECACGKHGTSLGDFQYATQDGRYIRWQARDGTDKCKQDGADHDVQTDIGDLNDGLQQ